VNKTDESTATVGEARPPAKPRDRAATEARIVQAVGEVLSREGFASIGVNAIAKQAQVDKVLIYRYFGGLPELLKAYGQSGEFWPRITALLGADPQKILALPLAERYSVFFENFIDELRQRPLTIEILALEINERNALTIILEHEREQWGKQVAMLLGESPTARAPELRGLTLLLISGVQYLLLRSRTIRVFGGLDVRSDAGWAELKNGVKLMANSLLTDATLVNTKT
jgi:AcrR family transcriptional regulator